MWVPHAAFVPGPVCEACPGVYRSTQPQGQNWGPDEGVPGQDLVGGYIFVMSALRNTVSLDLEEPVEVGAKVSSSESPIPKPFLILY